MIQRFFFQRELKKFPFFFLLLFFTLLLGTLGLTGISIVSEQVQNKLQANAKQLLTSDLVVSARRDLQPEEKEALDQIVSAYQFDTYKVVDIYSMVTPKSTSQTRLAELRSIEEGFPFYGEIKLQNGEFSSQGLFISNDLSELWQIGIGEVLLVGELEIPVSGIVKQDSSQGLRGFSLAPRIYLSLSNVEKSGLLKPGSTGSWAYHYKFKELSESEIAGIKKKITSAIKDAGVKVTLPEESSEQTGRVLGYLTDFMALAALIGLILSLVGVFYLYQSHLASRLKDLCLLNLHGLPKKKIILGVLAQFSFVFLLVFIFQMVVIIPLYKFFAPGLSDNLGLELSSEINLRYVLLQLPFLFGLSFSVLVPLLMGLMRTPMGLQLKSSKVSMGAFRFFDFIPFVLLLWTFACFLSHSFKTGSLFFLALMIVFLLSTVLIRIVQLVINRFIKGKGLLLPSIETGVALRNLGRSGHKMTLSFLSIAMGATLISLILQLDRMIQKEFTLDQSKPGLFIFDIQEDQMEPLLDFAKSMNSELEGVTPMIRARLEKINGESFKREEASSSIRTRENEVDSRFRNRGINLTYRGDLSGAEKIIEGEPFPSLPPVDDRPAFVSVEKRFASRLGLKLGDKVTFDVQGVEIEGLIKNFREVKWTSFYPNFFVNVEPGFIDEAPKTYLAVLPAGERASKANFQREAVKKFSNISFIDVEELTGKLSSLFDKSRQAIEIISWLSLGVGLVILYGLSHDQVYRRYYDLALMKSLGFSSGSLRKHLIIEFGSIFGLAMGLGFFLGWGMAMLIGKEVFKISFTIDWIRILVPGLFLIILCLGTILISSWKATISKPRSLLSDS